MRVRVTPLSVCHLAFFAAIALYLCAFHGAGETPVLTIFFAGVIAELLPRWLRRLFLPEFLLIVVTGFAWWKLMPPDSNEAMHATAGMAIAYWLLVPSRLAMLRWVLSLVIVELILQSRHPQMGLSTLVAVPIGLAALGLDSWLLAAVPARSSSRMKSQLPNSILRWAIAPVSAVIVVCIMLGSWMVTNTAAYHAAHKPAAGPGKQFGPVVIGLEESLSIGDHNQVDRDPRIAARLTWDSGPDPVGVVYLRALALSRLQLGEGTLSWQPNNSGVKPAPPPSHIPTRWARILRMPSRTDVVLRPDGGDATDLDGLVIDGDGNLYRQLLGEGMRIYRVDFDDGQLEADPNTFKTYRYLDPALANMPWETIEDPRWKDVSPERAATLISNFLQGRCSYALEKLPTPAAGPGGALRSFLFGRTESVRRGHCQYFSTAAVILLRRAGHIARCVAGFASDELDDRGVVFRGLHAHAWIEVVNAKGRWQRFDPTPAIRNRAITEGIHYNGNSPSQINESQATALPPVDPDNPMGVNGTLSTRTMMILLGCGAVLLFVVWFLIRSRRQVPLDPRLAALQKRNDDLIRLAVELGIPVKQATTLSVITEALEQRSGLDLQSHLRAHLDARYGNGPLPSPWPIDEVRRHAQARRQAHVASQ